jgi:hypothetical protein
LEEWVETNIVKYPKIKDNYDEYLESKKNNNLILKIKDEIKRLLYQNRNLVKETKKKQIIDS